MIYIPCGREVYRIIDEMMQKYHKELVGVGATCVATYVFDERHPKTGDPVGKALECKGVAAEATVRPTNLKERAKGVADIEILICGPSWIGMKPEERNALIDHELEHVEIVLDRDTGEPKVDDRGRPVLTSKDHDIDLGFFLVMAERHGVHACEVRASRDLFRNYGELLMMDGQAGNARRDKELETARKKIKALERANQKQERELEALRAIIQVHDQRERKKQSKTKKRKKP